MCDNADWLIEILIYRLHTTKKSTGFNPALVIQKFEKKANHNQTAANYLFKLLRLIIETDQHLSLSQLLIIYYSLLARW